MIISIQLFNTTKFKYITKITSKLITYLAYSCGNGEEYHVCISYFPNSIAAGHRGCTNWVLGADTVVEVVVVVIEDVGVELTEEVKVFADNNGVFSTLTIAGSNWTDWK